MRSKDVVIGMKVKVHDITWPNSTWTFAEMCGENPTTENVTFYVKKYSSRDGCWILSRRRGSLGMLYVMAKDFEPYIEEGE